MATARIGLAVYRRVAQILGNRYRATLTRLTSVLDETLRDVLRETDIFANV